MKKNLLVVLIAAFAASSAFAGALDGGTSLSANGVAIGPSSFEDQPGCVAIGAGADCAAPGAVALGSKTIAREANTVDVGGRRMTGLADGRNADDAVNLSQAWRLRDDLRRGIAAVAATPNLPALAAGERTVAAGIAAYGGFAAVGVTYAEALSNSAQVYVGANFSGDADGTVFRAGGAWKF